MAGNLQETLERISNKTELLIEKYALLMSEKKQADARIEELYALLTSRQKEIEMLKQEIEYLKIATTITPDHKDVEKSRAILSGLVREIDKCINELSE